MSGWFAMRRGVTSHPLLKGHPERIAIWLWLIDNAAWKEVRHDVKGRMVMVPRGAVLVSQRRLAAEVGVTYEVVRRFLIRLRQEDMIATATVSGRTQITLCNYKKYQHTARSDNAAPTQEKLIKEQGYKDTSVSEETAVPKNPSQEVFDRGVVLLCAAGVPVRRAKGVLGRWRREHGDAALVAAIGRAAREGAIEPVAFIEGCLRRGGRIDDQTHFGAFGSIPEVSA